MYSWVCVGGDWQFQQMCSMRWQRDIYFACSIWHVWMLPCILSWCEVIARDVQPRWNHSLLSLLHQYQNVFLTNREKQQEWWRYPVGCFVLIFIFSSRLLWLTMRAEQTQTIHPFSICHNRNLTDMHTTTQHHWSYHWNLRSSSSSKETV